MSAVVYYFTATGNSLAVARDIADLLNGRLVPIAAVVDQGGVAPDAEAVGIVFPVYYANLGGSGLPLIVERFAAQLEHIDSPYMVAVCTHAGEPGATIGHLARRIATRGGTLAAGFAVQMSYPYPVADKLGHALLGRALRVDPRTEDRARSALFTNWQSKLQVIREQVSARSTGHLEASRAGSALAKGPLLALQNRIAVRRYRHLAHASGGSLSELIPLADASLSCDSRCTGCGICARVCPVGNIRLVDGRPVWQHHCETCYACYQWCPQGAIGGDLVEYEKRYHHPGVTLADMLRQRPQAV